MPVERQLSVRGTPAHDVGLRMRRPFFVPPGYVTEPSPRRALAAASTHHKMLEATERRAREVMPHFGEDAHVDETAGIGR